jgi:hypothetical protein
MAKKKSLKFVKEKPKPFGDLVERADFKNRKWNDRLNA